MIIANRDAFLVLQETAMHPHSVVLDLQTRFEKPSIVRVFSQEGLRQYTTPPIYDKKYLVIFEDVKTMNSNLSYVHLEFMQPVIVCRGKSMVDEAIEVLQKKECPYALYVNIVRNSPKSLIANWLCLASLLTQLTILAQL